MRGRLVERTLLNLLDLERIETDIFRGFSFNDAVPVRVFGGQVAAQALVAAGRTVDADRSVQSLHAYFLRGGDPLRPILYRVERLRDGRNASVRRVTGVQAGTTIFTLSASFGRTGRPEHEHQDVRLDAPPPEDARDLQSWLSGREPDSWSTWMTEQRFPCDVRFVERPAQLVDDTTPREPRQRVWTRVSERLPDSGLLHACALTYLTDLDLLSVAYRPHPHANDVTFMSSVDHAVWFHRPFRADDWLLHDRRCPVSASSHVLAHGQIFTPDGLLVATVAMEGVLGARRAAADARIVIQ